MNINNCTFSGNLGADPVVRTIDTKNGPMKVANFRIACNTYQQGEVKPDWFRVVAFAKLAEITEQYLKKGNGVIVVGSIHTRSWEDAEGITRYGVELELKDLSMLPKAAHSAQEEEERASDGKLPF